MLTGLHHRTELMLAALQLVDRELLLFAAFWFIVSALDEMAIDLSWLFLRLTGRATAGRIGSTDAERPLLARAAVLVPAWHEAVVLEAMVAHTLAAWQQRDFALYVGCYRNDPATMAAAIAGSGGDPRVRVVLHDCLGPTTKADCLNRLYRALCADELRQGQDFASVVLHDAEDMVHPAALTVIDRALTAAEFVQLPVRPETQPKGRWIAGHYSDEFTEAHGKALVVRDAFGAALPAAGVGCGFSRTALADIARLRGEEGKSGPFAADCLTEDYELGLLIARSGGRSKFLRLRDAEGQLVATRSYFPARFDQAVRQKTRWIHGIALQGWDRLGWQWRPIELWMMLRDRRGPLTALVLAAAYLILVVEAALTLAQQAGWIPPLAKPPVLTTMIWLCFASLVWRAAVRFAFTTREYGVAEGIRAVLRIPVANLIAIIAGRRALWAYLRSLNGSAAVWDKTAHDAHPAALRQLVVALPC